jgi:DNA-binding Lrp family transcriptional regulator
MGKPNDKIDRQLLALLQANARESATALASKLGVARTTIQERIQRLESNGTICGYSAILSRDPFDGYTQSILFVSVGPRNLKTVLARLTLFPEIKLCQLMSGDYDLCCRIAVPHVEDLGAILQEIAEIPGVERVKSWIVMSTHFDRMDSDLGTLTAKRAAISRGEAG